MFYKIRNDIQFRQYDGHGYIADNSEFGYRFLSDSTSSGREEYVSESGSVMLASLSKTPRSIEEIVADLMRVFIGVNREVLKEDVIEFFQMLVERGLLSVGETMEDCVDRHWSGASADEDGAGEAIVPTENCTRDRIGPDDFLRSIHIEIASACNERCVHCYIPHQYKTDMIDLELLYRILDEARELNVVHVTLSGGEPMLHKELIGFLSRCRELDLSVNVLSNLTLLSDDILNEMRENPLLSVQTSLYSMDAAVHDGITRQAGSFEKTKDELLRVIDAGIPAQISCPIMRQNKDSFIDVVSWGREHDIAVAIEPVIFASYDHSGANLENRIPLNDLEGVLEKEFSHGHASMLSDSAEEKESVAASDPVCSICRYSLCVAANGDVYPCVGWQTNVLGNLAHQSLRDIWVGSEKLHRLREVKRGGLPQVRRLR